MYISDIMHLSSNQFYKYFPLRCTKAKINQSLKKTENIVEVHQTININNVSNTKVLSMSKIHKMFTCITKKKEKLEKKLKY